MIIVDTNAWADFFNGVRAPHAERLQIGAELLSPDADFRHIARHTALRLWTG